MLNKKKANCKADRTAKKGNFNMFKLPFLAVRSALQLAFSK